MTVTGLKKFSNCLDIHRVKSAEFNIINRRADLICDWDY